MNALIDRLQLAVADSRELDCAIALEFGGFFEVPPRFEGDGVGYGYSAEDGTPIHPGYGGDQLVPHYTKSVDAILRLAFRLLPEHDYLIGSTNGGLTIHCQFGPDPGLTGFGETLPLAICVGLAKALDAEGRL